MSVPQTRPGHGVEVVLVEDHELLAHSVALALRAEGVATEVIPPTGCDEVLGAVRTARPRVALLDLDLRGPIGRGDALIPSLVDLGTRVLVVTGVTDRARLGACIEAGASGYLAKAEPLDRLVAVLSSMARGEAPLTPAERHDLLCDLRATRSREREALGPFEELTGRERQVLAGLMEGRCVEVLAKELYLSEATIRANVRGILAKLGVHSQLAAVAEARRVGWTG